MSMQTEDKAVISENGKGENTTGLYGGNKKKRGSSRYWILVIVLFILVVLGGVYAIWTIQNQAENDLAVVHERLDVAASDMADAQEANAATLAALQTNLSDIETAMAATQEQNAADFKALQTKQSDTENALAEAQEANTAVLAALQTNLADIETAMAATQEQNVADVNALQTKQSDTENALAEAQEANTAVLAALQTNLANIETASAATQERNVADLEALQTRQSDTETAMTEAQEANETALAALQTNLADIESAMAANQEQNIADLKELQALLNEAENEIAELKIMQNEFAAKISVTRTITPGTASEDQTVMVIYDIVNEGTVPINNLALVESKDILAAKLNIAAELKTGEEAYVRLPVVMGKKDLISKATITYTIADGTEEHTCEVESKIVSFTPNDDLLSYNDAIEHLGSISLIDKDELNLIHRSFKAIGSYDLAPQYMYLAEILFELSRNEDVDFDRIDVAVTILKAQKTFIEGYITNNSLAFIPFDSLVAYIQARKLEANGKVEEAYDIYVANQVLDSIDRAIAIALD